MDRYGQNHPVFRRKSYVRRTCCSDFGVDLQLSIRGGVSVQHLRRRHSISVKLPALISALLVVAIAIFSVVAHRQLKGVLLATAASRVTSATHVLGGLFDDSEKRLRAESEKLTSDSAVKRFATAPNAANRAAAQKSLAKLISTPQGQQTIGVEVRDKQGHRVLWADGPAADSATFISRGPERPIVTRTTPMGRIQTENGNIFYQVATPVIARPTDTVGTVVVYKRISSANGAQLIGRLIGSEASLLIGNADGTVWTDMSKIVRGPTPTTAGKNALIYNGPDGKPQVGSARRIAHTPWVLWVGLPLSSALAPANQFLRDMTIAAILLALVGGFAALLISRQMTAPLREITLAAQGIEAGDYSRRVKTHRHDELGILAKTFNGMAIQVESAREDLEARVRSRTSQLEAALGELHSAQESLVRREKLAMLGQLAGGVGHELRNPLGVMTNALYYLGMVLKDATPDVKEYLGILRTQIGLSEKIVGDLLDFARLKPPTRETVTVERIVKEQLERVGPTDNIVVNYDFPADLPPVRVDRIQIGQVVLNLLTNALQSMEGNGGTLTLRGRHNGNGCIKLDVIDTGVGMSLEQLDKMFEPLFTTKARGIGLGLAVSRSLAEANGGVITASSEPGKGSTVSVDLPMAKADAV
ncbi:MAG TPA: ATP-binding protein [Gemmatimonadaceae bacterium]|nr:ATP-binding protein [Gemmatimonadaceae bacterium]